MPLRVLIVDGQYNHSIWPTNSEIIYRFLEETSLFALTRLRAQQRPEELDLEFNGYDAVVLLYNPNPGADVGPLWPESTRRNMEKYMRAGGGLVVVHATNNAFAHWIEFNQMTGIGGWGGRTSGWGPYIYYDDNGQLRRDTAQQDPRAGTDGPPHEFVVSIRDPAHPIVAGMPTKWKHCMDEIYERLRGPANNLNVLATAYSDNVDWYHDATKRHEPVVMTIDYHEGRVFHTTLGHWSYSLQCIGLITLLQRGVEWVATGSVTQNLPVNFPTAEHVSYRRLEWPNLSIREWTPYH